MHDERVRIEHCMGRTRSAGLAKRVIAFTFSDFVRKQDRPRSLISLCEASSIGRHAVWREICERINTLEEDLGAANLMSRVIKVSAK